MSEETALDEAHDGHPSDSVFDFLYSDPARIASLLAQFDPAGHLTGAKMTETVEDTSGDKTTGLAKGGVPPFVGASVSYEGAVGKKAAEGAERTYDPYWANARELLNLLSPRLVRDLTEARIGQIVVATGSLAVADFSMFKNIWSLPAVRREIKSGMTSDDTADVGNRSQRRANKGKDASAKKIEDENADAVMSIIGNMPHLITSRLETEDSHRIYASLLEPGLVGTTHDLLLKHGSLISGAWTIVGIVDALPELDAAGEVAADAAYNLLRGREMIGGVFGEILGELIIPLRTLLGRPFNHFGVTPLMIFREIAE